MTDISSRVRARFDHEAQKKILAEKYRGKMLFAHAGGMWQAGPELLSVLAMCDEDQAVVLDCYQNPVRVQVSELTQMARERWQEQMNAWLMEWTQLQGQR